HDHVHASEQEALLALHLGLEHQHPVEALACQFAAASVNETQMRCQSAKFPVTEWRQQALEPQRRIPSCIKTNQLGLYHDLLRNCRFGIDHRARYLQMLV